MTRQTSIQLTPATKQQVAALKAAGWGTFTEIVRVAIDRMAQQELAQEDTMKVGDVVTIYQKPITEESYEGKAKLVQLIRPDEGDGLSMWRVRFLDEPKTEYTRTVYQAPQ